MLLVQERAKQKLFQELEKEHKRFAELISLVSLFKDETRFKVIMVFSKSKEVCPSDIAEILRTSKSCISHQLKTLTLLGLIKKEKRGRISCYQLTSKGRKVIKILREIIKEYES